MKIYGSETLPPRVRTAYETELGQYADLFSPEWFRDQVYK